MEREKTKVTLIDRLRTAFVGAFSWFNTSTKQPTVEVVHSTPVEQHPVEQGAGTLAYELPVTGNQRTDADIYEAALRVHLRRAGIELDGATPIQAGRQTEPRDVNSIFSTLTTIQPDYPPQFLDVLVKLASLNPDISFAVSNIVDLANTKYHISFGDEVAEEQAKEMQRVLTNSITGWYETGGSDRQMIADFFDQLVVTGAMSHEAVIEEDLSGIKSVVKVDPQTIEFKYSEDQSMYEPYQRVNSLPSTTNRNRDLVNGNLIKLNTRTYRYYALRTRGEKPYGIPPYLSSLNMSKLENKLLENFDKVIKNMGVLGFLQVLANKPMRDMRQGTNQTKETDDEYYARCLKFLDKFVRPQAELGFRSGVMAGFKQDLEMKFEKANSANLSGAKDIVEMVTVQKHAGLKQDPIMLGRPFNTSEALGRVIFNKLAAQIESYQTIVSCGLAYLFQLELILQGFPVVPVKVWFDPPDVKDRLQAEEALEKRIDNNRKLWQDGIITKTQYANNLGYEEPADDTPPPPREGEQAPQQVTDNNNKLDLGLISRVESFLGADLPQYLYGSNCCPVRANFQDDEVEKKIEGYDGEMQRLYRQAVRVISVLVSERISRMRSTATATDVFNAAYAEILKNWGDEYAVPSREIIQKWVTRSYRSFRKDKDIFGGAKTIKINGKDTKIPVGTFDTIDLRVVDYMREGDELYLGKFITDADTKKRLKVFIFDEFANGRLPLGQAPNQQEFIKNLAATLNIEAYKITRVVATTTNKLKNYAAVSYMQQVGVERYKVLALIDNKTSEICRRMNGKTFSVSAARARISSVSKTLPKNVPNVTPFVNSVFDDLKDIDDLTGDELLTDHKIFSPPFHANCRTQLIAVL